MIDKLQKLFDNPKKAIIGILVVVGLFSAYKCSATEIEVGPTHTGEFNGGFALTLSERIFDDKIDIGVALVSEQEWERAKVGNNGNFWFGYVAQRPDNWVKVLPSEVTIGGGVWFRDDYAPITNCHPSYMLGVKWRFGDHASVGIRHWSNAGVCDDNRGQDLLTFGWRF